MRSAAAAAVAVAAAAARTVDTVAVVHEADGRGVDAGALRVGVDDATEPARK